MGVAFCVIRSCQMGSIFTVNNEVIGLLDSQTAVLFFRDLLWAEARRTGIPVGNVSISLRTSVADGGIDASVRDTESERLKSSGLIMPGLTGYQIKTGDSFKPWQDSEIRKELFGNKPTAKENLGKGVKECLDKAGTFVLVCFGQDPTSQQVITAKNLLKKYFVECGYNNINVEVWGQSSVVGFAGLFPSLTLDVQGFEKLQFQSHKSWSSQDDMQKELKLGEPQNVLIESIRNELRQAEEAIHLRICAEPGAGKTRLVLEATNAEDLKPLVVYCDSAKQFLNSNLMNEILKDDNDFAVILVIDECNSEKRAAIWNKLKNLGSRVKLITIYNEFEDCSGSTKYFDVPLLAKEEISGIIQAYGVREDHANKWEELCSGSPRVAHVIGWNLKNNPSDLLKPLDTVDIWDRYIVGSDDPNDPDVKQRKLVLQHIALFRKFGFEAPLLNEAEIIAGMVQKVDPQVTFLKFQQIVKKLKERKILQGETTLYITPKALHIHLWRGWWESFGSNFDVVEFTKSIPEELRRWFYEMFKYGAESSTATKVVDNLLGDDGPFIKDNFIKTKIGSDFFLVLTEANPKAALKCLQKTVGTWTKEEIRGQYESRRSVVWALERIVVWKELFCEGARLLLLLAESEIEKSIGNNASGVFAELFSPGPGGVSPSVASPEERFPIIKEALESNSKEKRLLGIKACGQALQTHHFHKIVGPEYQGLKSAELWRPQNGQEMIDAYKRIWEFLFSKIDSLEADEQKEAISVLLNNIRGLSLIQGLDVLIIEDLRNLSGKDYADKKEILEDVESVVYYGRDKISPESLPSWKSLRDDLIGTGFASQMQRYVAMDLTEDRFDEEGKRVDKAEKPLKSLVKQALSNPEILGKELPWLVTTGAKNGYRFAYLLGQADNGFSLLPMLLEAQKKVTGNEKSSDYFLGGYLKALYESDSEKWELLMDELAKDAKMAVWVGFFTWRSQLTDRSALRIYELADKGVLEPYHFRVFGLGSVIIALSEDIFLKWIDFLLNSPEGYSAAIAMDLYQAYYFREGAPNLPKETTLRLLTNPSLFKKTNKSRRDPMDDYHWTTIGKKFIELYPKESLQLGAVILENFGEDGTILEGYGNSSIDVIDSIAKIYPEETWGMLSKYIDPPIDSRGFHIRSWLRSKGFFEGEAGALSAFNPELVWKWVEEDKEKRAWHLATFVPKVLFRGDCQICWARELLVRYGDQEDVRRNLYANFSTEGWSGPSSLHHEGKKQELLKFLENEDDENVKIWIKDFVSSLETQIAAEKIREERGY